MKRNITARVADIAIASVAAGVLAACAHQPPEPLVKGDLVQQTATVESVDLPTRMVSLRNEDGRQSSVVVDPEVRNLDQVRVGDRVVVSFFEGVAAQVKAPGTGVKDVEETTNAVRAKPGERPAGAVGSTVKATVKIESVDTSFNTVSFRRPDGHLRMVAVETPEARSFIQRLRPGDEVEVTYTEAVAVEVRPAQ
jgi:hypothetical protein